jgi:hypothetical protein
MDSDKLSKRTKQPGHDQTFVASERSFIAAARACLDPNLYEVVDKPKDLGRLFPAAGNGKAYGVEPEAAIVRRDNGRRFFVEVKKQNERGNAEERDCKHHSVQFQKTLKAFLKCDFHPYVTVFCDSLATLPRYTAKIPYFFEPDDYLLWVDYRPDLLAEFLRKRCAQWLDPR